jgi:glutathione S-transferase
MLKLVIANKLYSSWSMRPWLVLRAFGIPFEEIIIPLRQADSKARLAEYSPSGKVPVLIDGSVTVWESLAVVEYLAECFPDKAIWPKDSAARAHARAISNEMHGGFMPLRQGCPMNLGAKFKTPELTEGLVANAARIEAIWAEARSQFGAGGKYLYGTFSAADAMYAPVVTRLDTYQIPVQPESRAYMDTVLSHPEFVSWKTAALKEPWSIEDYEAGHTVVEAFR